MRLVWPAELTGSGQHTAAIDEDRQAECFAVFQGKCFARQFGRAVQRNRDGGRKGFAHARRTQAGGQRSARGGTKGVLGHLHWQGRKRCDRVNTAGAQQHKPGAVLLAVLEQVHRARENVFDELPRTGADIDSGQHARIGRGIDHPVAGRQGFQIAGGAEITVINLYAQPDKFCSIGLAAGTAEIIQAVELVSGAARGEGPRQRAASETADAGEKRFASVEPCEKPRGRESAIFGATPA